MSPEELKHKSVRVLNNIEPSMEADLTELVILQASENLEVYQEETRKWRNKKNNKQRHRQRRLGSKKEDKCRNHRQTSIQVGWPLHSVILQQARILSLGRHRRKRATVFLEC